MLRLVGVASYLTLVGVSALVGWELRAPPALLSRLAPVGLSERAPALAVTLAPSRIAVQVALDHAVAEVDPRFLSFAVDTAQVVGGDFWAPLGTGEGLLDTRAGKRFDFASPRLRRLASALGPAYLRIGGTAADKTVYRVGAATAGADELPEGASWALTGRRWDEVNDFARAVDLRIMFTLNAGRSARDGDGGWSPANARSLIEYSQARGFPVDVWELGNEANAFPVVHWSWLSARRYASDLRTARRLLDDLHAPARLAGLGTAVWPVMGEWRPFSDEVLRRAGDVLDVVTWHYYPQQSHRCPIATRRADPAAMPSADGLADVDRWAGWIETMAHAHAPAAAIWLGETGSAQCGGEPGFSNTFGDALWWVDEMGRVARRGQKVIVRQTLAGSDYGLIDERTLAPNPSFWASWLWRGLMGERVLSVRATTPTTMTTTAPAAMTTTATAAAASSVSVYAHCLREPRPGSPAAPAGAVVLAAVNADASRAATLELPTDLGAPSDVLRFEADGIGAHAVRLDGVTLAAGSDGSPPELFLHARAGTSGAPPTSSAFPSGSPPASIAAPAPSAAPPTSSRFPASSAVPAPSAALPLEVPPLSILFIVLPRAGAAACSGT